MKKGTERTDGEGAEGEKELVFLRDLVRSIQEVDLIKRASSVEQSDNFFRSKRFGTTDLGERGRQRLADQQDFPLGVDEHVDLIPISCLFDKDQETVDERDTRLRAARWRKEGGEERARRRRSGLGSEGEDE